MKVHLLKYKLADELFEHTRKPPKGLPLNIYYTYEMIPKELVCTSPLSHPVKHAMQLFIKPGHSVGQCLKQGEQLSPRCRYIYIYIDIYIYIYIYIHIETCRHRGEDVADPWRWGPDKLQRRGEFSIRTIKITRWQQKPQRRWCCSWVGA